MWKIRIVGSISFQGFLVFYGNQPAIQGRNWAWGLSAWFLHHRCYSIKPCLLPLPTATPLLSPSPPIIFLLFEQLRWDHPEGCKSTCSHEDYRPKLLGQLALCCNIHAWWLWHMHGDMVSVVQVLCMASPSTANAGVLSTWCTHAERAKCRAPAFSINTSSQMCCHIETSGVSWPGWGSVWALQTTIIFNRDSLLPQQTIRTSERSRKRFRKMNAMFSQLTA